MMIGMDGQQGGGDYALGYTDEERQRLIEQGELVGHFTMRLLQESGIASGMRVLDVGCGIGAVSILTAAVIGPQGSVIGVDADPVRWTSLVTGSGLRA
jgi:cyclopropane fatty-acyl-phospholipid synthase-like methyltransferase